MQKHEGGDQLLRGDRHEANRPLVQEKLNEVLQTEYMTRWNPNLHKKVNGPGDSKDKGTNKRHFSHFQSLLKMT